MTTVALAGLVLYLALFAAVLLLVRRARRVIAVAGSDEQRAEGPTGAELGERLLAEQRLAPVQVVIADVDAYRAVHRELQLTAAHAGTATPAAWAVAAHEVAHAGQHRSGDRAWARWWVLSGHAVWASVALPLLLLLGSVTGWLLALLLAAGCALILAASGLLSRATERSAVAAARGMLAEALAPDAAAAADAPLRAAARAYTAESVLDLGLLDRLAEARRSEPGATG